MFDPTYTRKETDTTSKQCSFILNQLAKGLEAESKSNISVQELYLMAEEAYYADERLSSMIMPF